MKRVLRIVFSLVLTAAAVWLSIRNIDLSELGRAFGRVQYFWAILAAANTVFSVYALGWRWEILLRTQVRIPLAKLFRFNILSQMVNIAAPARIGEFARAYLVSREGKVSVSFALGTILVERLLDMAVFAAIWIVTPALMALSGPFVSRWTLRALFFLPAVILISFAVWPRLFQRAAAFIGKLLPLRARERMIRIIHQALEAFATIRRTRTSVVLVAWTIGLIFSQILTNVFVFKAVGLSLGLAPALFVLLAVQVGSIPPAVPGKIGVFEYAVILALGAFGVARSEALAYALMLHLTVFLPKIVLGLIYLLGTDIRLRSLRAENIGNDRLSKENRSAQAPPGKTNTRIGIF